MARGQVKRFLAAVILVAFGCLSLLAIMPAVLGVRLDDEIRRRVASLAADSVAVVGPLRVSAAPHIMLTRARAKAIGSPDGSARTIELSDAVFAIETTAAAAAGTEQATAELTSVLGEVTSIRIKNGAIDLTSDGRPIATLRDVEADLSARSGRLGQARGQASYLGQTIKFDIDIPGRSAISGVNAEWPLRITLSAPSFEATAKGVFEVGEGWSFKGETEARSSDTAKLATWLTQAWSGAATSPAFLIKGPMTWSNGVIAFGKSRVSLGDQDGVGALSLSMRDKRPLIEAALAFDALDVTALLYSQPPAKNAKDGPLLDWRCLATHFPAARSVDADLRLSATRLQWRGDPIGKAAFTVSARGGLVHADFAELALGSFSGSLQIAIDERQQRVPVVLRARLQAPNAALISDRIFASPIIAGSATAQLEISGQGETLGQVLDHGSGRGTIDARDGQLLVSLPAAQRLLAAPSKPLTTGWAPIAGTTPYQTIAAKLQMRDGAIQIDEAAIRSGPLTIVANGRVGLASGDLDLRLRFEPSRGDGQGTHPADQRGGLSVTGNPRLSQSLGGLAIAGGWAAPVLTVIPYGPVP